VLHGGVIEDGVFVVDAVPTPDFWFVDLAALCDANTWEWTVRNGWAVDIFIL